ncbi:MAG: Hpt domain-containing protein [Rhizobiaceae bacterium]
MSPVAAFNSAHGAAAIRHRASECKPVCAKPVDLVHLSKQSLGDRALETEILRLFLSQSVLYLDRMSNASTKSERRLAAHTIIGSAKGIGAWKVAQCAAPHAEGCDGKVKLGELRNAVVEANEYIEMLLVD